MDGPPPSTLSADQMQEIREAFHVFDPHDSGVIPNRKMGNVLRSLGQFPTEAELYDIIDEIDVEGEGEIKYPDFEAMIVKRVEATYKDESLRAAFKLFDRDEDGFISQAELRTVMFNLGERCTEEEFFDMMKEVDTDNDGRISYTEFVAALRH